jgi:tRNA-specific 2-thiouridylase
VIVGPREALKQHDIYLKDMNWLGEPDLSTAPVRAFAKIRSTRPPIEATVQQSGEGAKVSIVGGEFGVSPGQACVIYDGVGPGARVLGGGFIASQVN